MVATIDKYSWYDVPPGVKDLLFLASEHWEDRCLAERYINQALEKAGNNTNVLIGAYRFFFYSGRSAIALDIAEKVLRIARCEANLPVPWEEVKPMVISRREEPSIRLFLHAYSAIGFLKARLGLLDEARTIVENIKAIDDRREYCATTVFEVLTRSPDEE